MSRQIACHVTHYRSRVDDTDQPLVVAIPDPPPKEPLPFVVLLHDTLEPPTRETFVDVALAEVARWREPLRECTEPAAILLPMGRGNAGWIGLGGTDLFEALAHATSEYSLDPARILLAGAGAGGTGALQLGTWFPDRWRALAMAAPFVDERLDAVAPLKSSPPWEQVIREATRPSTLVTNLADMPLWIDHPNWYDGLFGTAHPDHALELTRLLQRGGAEIAGDPGPTSMLEASAWPRDIRKLLTWFLSLPPRTTAETWTHTAHSPRSTTGIARIDRPFDPGRCTSVKVRQSAAKCRIDTKNAAEITLTLPREGAVVLDGQKLAVPANTRTSEHSTYQRLGEKWEQMVPDQHASKGGFKTPELSGPVWDMRWEGIIFVPGTLGDDRETSTYARLAQFLRQSWIDGIDSPNPYPGNRSAVVDYPVIADTDITEAQLASRHLVVIGTPRTNLLLARLRGRLACEWPAPELDEQTLDPFRFAGRTYRDPRHGLFLLGANPDVPSRYLLLITGTTPEAVARAVSFRTSYLPDFLVFHGPEAVRFGFCGPDWQPTS